jgi:nitrate reductase NapE component
MQALNLRTSNSVNIKNVDTQNDMFCSRQEQIIFLVIAVSMWPCCPASLLPGQISFRVELLDHEADFTHLPGAEIKVHKSLRPMRRKFTIGP